MTVKMFNRRTEFSDIKEKRQYLKTLSDMVKARVQTEKNPDAEHPTTNEALIEELYKTDLHREFNSVRGWNRQGYNVAKGEKGFLLWGKPKKNKVVEPVEGEDDEYSFFPIAHVFSNAQVKPMQQNAA